MDTAAERPTRRRVLISVVDITTEHAREADLAHRATHDALTGLANRDQFRESVERALCRLDGNAGHVALLFVDLDGFKAVTTAPAM